VHSIKYEFDCISSR